MGPRFQADVPEMLPEGQSEHVILNVQLQVLLFTPEHVKSLASLSTFPICVFVCDWTREVTAGKGSVVNMHSLFINGDNSCLFKSSAVSLVRVQAHD